MSNKLANEKSAYLIQHSHNPVNWYPWGEEAFHKANQENKIIFLSIGYSACHWCHVMAAESFQNKEIADFLNKDFVSIKVDKEEMPDIDHIYMMAVQALTGSGGWPLTVFLTPDLKPFYGGTYFPPYDKSNYPGFKTILGEIAMLWKKRPDKVYLLANELLNALKEEKLTEKNDMPNWYNLLHNAFANLANQFDPVNGGFGNAPKFPMPMTLEFLLKYHEFYKNKETMRIVQESCYKMALGGIYDHIGGGFFRYSVDEKWHIPHFEKMLYVNSQLASIYFLAYTTLHEDSFKAIAMETLNYMDRELRSPEGAYYASQDADSEGDEGKFYLWTYEEIHKALGNVNGSHFCSLFNIEAHGNFKDEFSVPYPNTLINDAKTEELKRTLFEARSMRVNPFIDNKVLLDWNALALSALISAYRTTSLNYYMERAQNIYLFVANTLFKNNALYHCWIEGEARIEGFIDDYAFCINAFLDLHKCVQEKSIFAFAVKLVELMLEYFYDPSIGLMYNRPSKYKILNITIPNDSATPSGIAMAAMLLIKLGKILNNKEFTRIGEQTVSRHISAAAQHPLSYSQMLLTLLELMKEW